MIEASADELAQRRLLEDELIALGAEREKLIQEDSWNRERIRRLVGPARAAGIRVRDIARMTGVSAQTLHTWMADLMRPIPDIHLGQIGPAPATLEQAVLRIMGDDPERDWSASEVRDQTVPGWPSGSVGEVDMAMETLARWHMIWDSEDGYRVARPADTET